MSRDFNTFLQERFKAGVARNPRFSLRAFAKTLGTDPSTLSQILRGQRPVTAKSIERLGQKLGLSRETIRIFQEQSSKARRTGASIGEVPLDQFHVLADWQHFALLKLTHVKGFQGNSKWIAKALGISIDSVNIIIQRLCRLDLLKLGRGNAWQDTSNKASSQFVGASGKLRDQIQREGHELALAALEEVDEARRLESHLTIAIDCAQLPQIQEKIAEFSRELAGFAAKPSTKNDVYKMQFAFFPLTNLNKESAP